MKYLTSFDNWQAYRDFLATNPKERPSVVFIKNSGARVDASVDDKFDPDGPCWIYTVDNDGREIN